MAAAAMILSSCADSIKTSSIETETINSKVEYVAPVSTKCGLIIPPCVDYSLVSEAYFYIRIDGRIPAAVGTWNSAEYFPQTIKGACIYDKKNKGVIYTDKSLYKSAEKKGVPQYVFDPTGKATVDVIKSMPKLGDLIAADQSFKGIKGIDTDDLIVIWYVVKYQTSDKVWHIDGVLTKKGTESITDIPGIKEIIDDEYEEFEPSTPEEPENPETPETPETPAYTGNGSVEFDIHVQEHKDWNEIKTSIHVRDTVNCRIVIPIPESMQAPADDVVIRAGEMYEYITESFEINGEEFSIDFTVSHSEQGIEITVATAGSAKALEAARAAFNDGLTFEIHTYVKPEFNEAEIWDYVKQTKCPQTSMTLWAPGATLWESIEKDVITRTYGQISSASRPDMIKIDYSPVSDN